MIYSKFSENKILDCNLVKQVIHFKNAFTQTVIKLLKVIESLLLHLFCIKSKAAHQQSPKTLQHIQMK